MEPWFDFEFLNSGFSSLEYVDQTCDDFFRSDEGFPPIFEKIHLNLRDVLRKVDMGFCFPVHRTCYF